MMDNRKKHGKMVIVGLLLFCYSFSLFVLLYTLYIEWYSKPFR